MILRIHKKTVIAFIKLSSFIYSRYITMYYKVKLGENVFFNKIPNIRCLKGTELIIGKNVRLNSNNQGYHINMHSKCKILLDRKDAKVTIGANTRIHGTCIHAYKNITIGENCLIAANTQIFDGNGHELSMENPSNRINTIGSSKPIVIEDNVWIGANVFVLPGVIIGEGSVISANSVVSIDIPKRSIAAGNPAIVIRRKK